MSIFVRQLGAITCEVKFDRHCNWIVTVIAWNIPFFSLASLILGAYFSSVNKGILLLENYRTFKTRWRASLSLRNLDLDLCLEVS